MKIERKAVAIIIGITIGTICMAFGASRLFGQKSPTVEEYVYISRVNSSLTEDKKESEKETKINEKEVAITKPENTNEAKVEETKAEKSAEETDIEEVENLGEENSEIVYEGLTLTEVSDQLNRSLNSTIANQGYLIASYSLENGIDPYLATAIILHETGCTWNCSTLVNQCNNVGGQKGGPSCGGGSYKSFPSLEEGIKSFINNLSVNYYAVGLTTPELMNSKYAASTTWASKVNTYIKKIKSV